MKTGKSHEYDQALQRENSSLVTSVESFSREGDAAASRRGHRGLKSMLLGNLRNMVASRRRVKLLTSLEPSIMTSLSSCSKVISVGIALLNCCSTKLLFENRAGAAYLDLFNSILLQVTH